MKKFPILQIIKENRFVGVIYCDDFLVFRNEAGEIIDVDNTKIRHINTYVLAKAHRTLVKGQEAYLIKTGEIERNGRHEIIFYVYSNNKIEL